MILLLIRILFAFFLLLSPLIAAETPEETLNVTAAPEFQIDIVGAFRPIIEENYWTIQALVAVYLVLEFYLFPFLEQCDKLAREEKAKEAYFKRREWADEYYKQRKEREREEREREEEERILEREAEELASVENWNYFEDYD